MLENKVTAESCNILHDPSCLQIEILPFELRQEIIAGIDKIIFDYRLTEPKDTIVNRRREDLSESVISSIIFEYRNFLLSYNTPDNIEEERYDLVKFIKSFETLRNNTILNHLPNYEEFLRSYGY
jgi:hypothetical protein